MPAPEHELLTLNKIMDCAYGESHFTTQRVADTKEGYTALELYRKSRVHAGNTQRVARIVFWDACGQFYIETFGTDIPVQIAEDLIAEAKATLMVR